MAKLSEMGPFRPTPGTARTISPMGYIEVTASKGVAAKRSDGALRPTAPDRRTGDIYNKEPQGAGRIKNVR